MLFTTTVELDESMLSDTPENCGKDMLSAALRVWFSYDDEAKFTLSNHADGSITITDDDEEATATISPLEFFKKHVELIWLAGTDLYRHDWIDFAFKSNRADADEYDDNTVDCVLQTMLYGKVVYG